LRHENLETMTAGGLATNGQRWQSQKKIDI